MYNILIVDDEYYICEGLNRKISQLRLPDINEIRTCLSGEEALSLCQTYKPHIVFTDIKMSGINGIDMIQLLSQKLHPVQFIVLSGYDDFDYVRGAFQSGAIDYLLKPVLNEDLVKVMTTALSSLKRHRKVSNNHRENLFDLARDVLREAAVLSPSAAPPSSVLSCLSHAGFSGNLCFAMLVSRTPQNYETLNHQLNTIYDHFDQVLCNTLSDCKIGILSDGKNHPKLQVFLSSFVNAKSDEKPSIWTASLTCVSDSANLGCLFQKADKLLCLRLSKGYGQLFTEADIPKEQGFSPRLKHLTAQFIETPSLAANNGQRIAFNKEIEQLRLSDLEHFFHYFNENLGIAHLNNNFHDWDRTFPSISDFSCYQELEQYFGERLREYAQKIASQNQPSNSMDMIRNYIDIHYMENLTLASLADHFFLSYSYLSKSFHKTFHMPFQEYLRMLRMEHALELLKNPELTIQQIAASVGYENAFNFSRSFKAQYGISPSQFRNKPE